MRRRVRAGSSASATVAPGHVCPLRQGFLVLFLYQAPTVGAGRGSMRIGERNILPGLLLGALWLVPVANAQPAERRSQAGTIEGIVTLDGCRAADVLVTLRADPLALPSNLVGATVPVVPRTVLASAMPIGEHRLEFRIEGLADGQLYVVGIRARRTALQIGGAGAPPAAYPPNPCDTLVWEGPPASVALAGGAALHVRGRAISGQLQVRTAEHRNGSRNWSRAGTFGLTNAQEGRIELRWRPPAGVYRGILQVALERFDRERLEQDCVRPDGLLHAAEVNVLPREFGGDPVFELPAVQLDQLLVPPDEVRDGSAGADTRPAAVTTAAYSKILLGKPVYARVVPIDEVTGEPRCAVERDGLPAWVVLVIANAIGGPSPEPPDADALAVLSPATYRGPVIYSYPDQNHLCMRSTRGHTLFWFMPTDFLVINNTGYGHGDWFPEGQRFCWKTGGGGGGFDPIGSLVEIAGGILSPIEWLVNSVASGWASLKKFAVEAVASGIGEIGIPCGSSCKSVLSSGLEIGLAAAGIPPTIPNFEQLKQQGLDYVAAQIASQTGLPNDVTEWAVNNGYKALAAKFTDKMSKARGTSSGLPMVDWAVWDNGIEAATLQLVVQRSAVGKLNTALQLRGNAVHATQYVGVPRVMLHPNGQPGASSMTFNVALTPNLAGWQEPGPQTVSTFGGMAVTFEPSAQAVAGSLKSYWKSRILQNPCMPMAIDRVVQILLPVPAGVLATYPGVPVMLNSSPHHAPLLLQDGQAACYLAGAAQ